MHLPEHFRADELACRHCGALPEGEEYPAFLDALGLLRVAYNRPMRVSSGYRCPDHPTEAAKGNGALHAHTRGAVDVRVADAAAFDLLELAMALDWIGVGIQQNGERSARYLHLDRVPRPSGRVVWSY